MQVGTFESTDELFTGYLISLEILLANTKRSPGAGENTLEGVLRLRGRAELAANKRWCPASGLFLGSFGSPNRASLNVVELSASELGVDMIEPEMSVLRAVLSTSVSKSEL